MTHKKTLSSLQTKITLSLVLLSLVSLFLSGCRKEIKDQQHNLVSSKQTPTATESFHLLGLPYQEGDLVLGEQLKNPYTIDNMKMAYDNVIKRGIISIYPVEVRETHYYVKFMPRTWDEYDDLKEDTTLQLSDIPYDYEIIQNGNRFQDPSINDTLPTYQYATVKKGYVFNDTIQHEILSTLYIPEVDNTLIGDNEENESFVDELLDEAYTITGNFEDTIAVQPNQTEAKYTPGGNIKIFDTRLNTTYGMEGVKVTARRWFVVYQAHCDFNGNYRMKHRFERPCNYSVWFEYGRFLVKRGGVHWINGPKQKGDWNHTISDGYDRFAGHIFRAAYRYHYKNIDGLQRPFRWLGRKTSYIAKDANKSWAGTNPIIFNNIKIARWKTDKEEYMSDEVFSTTCHETGHTSHAIRMNTIFQYWQVSRQLQESWAIALEWVITHREYVDRGIANYGEFNFYPAANPPDFPNTYAYQYWNSAISSRYTPLYIDIIDGHNQSGQFYFPVGSSSVDDQVQNYSLAFIESEMLKHIYGLSSLSQELKDHKPAGVTDAQIDLLIGFY